MDENNKQSIIGLEKNFIWAKLRATAQKTASQITLRDCSRETWFIARFYVWSEQRTSKSGLQSFRILFKKKNQISTYTLNQYDLGMWNVVLSSKGTSIGVPGSERHFSSVTQLCLTICYPMDCSRPCFPVHHQLLELAQTHAHRVDDATEPSHPPSSPSPPLIFPSIRVFSNESVLHIRWPKYWSFSFSISPSNEYSGLISFRMDWFDLLAVQGTLKSHLQRHCSKASILQRSAFFMVQLSHPYKTGKTIALTRQNFVGKVMSLLSNMLSRLVIAFLPRSKHLLISWLQSPSAVTLEPKKRKSVTFHCFPIYLPWSDGTGCHGFNFLKRN